MRRWSCSGGGGLTKPLCSVCLPPPSRYMYQPAPDKAHHHRCVGQSLSRRGCCAWLFCFRCHTWTYPKRLTPLFGFDFLVCVCLLGTDLRQRGRVVFVGENISCLAHGAPGSPWVFPPSQASHTSCARDTCSAQPTLEKSGCTCTVSANISPGPFLSFSRTTSSMCVVLCVTRYACTLLCCCVTTHSSVGRFVPWCFGRRCVRTMWTSGCRSGSRECLPRLYAHCSSFDRDWASRALPMFPHPSSNH